MVWCDFDANQILMHFWKNALFYPLFLFWKKYGTTDCSCGCNLHIFPEWVWVWIWRCRSDLLSTFFLFELKSNLCCNFPWKDFLWHTIIIPYNWGLNLWINVLWQCVVFLNYILCNWRFKPTNVIMGYAVTNPVQESENLNIPCLVMDIHTKNNMFSSSNPSMMIYFTKERLSCACIFKKVELLSHVYQTKECSCSILANNIGIKWN